MENNQHQQNPKSQKISSSFTYNNNNNNNNNNRRKREACLKFQRGSCNYGYRCCFIHTNAHLIRPPRLPNAETKLCWRYMNGDTCPFGATCHFIHFKPKMDNNNTIIAPEMPMPWRTKLCHSWVSFGACKYGSNCSYAHGESELRKRGSSDNAEGVSCKWVDKTCEKEVNGMRWEFKWDVDKISHVYGDWINDTPLVHVDTGNIPT